MSGVAPLCRAPLLEGGAMVEDEVDHFAGRRDTLDRI
jgi:hypothetical protein